MLQNPKLRYQIELINTKQMLDKVKKLGIDVTSQKERLNLLILQLKTTTTQEKEQEQKDSQNLYILYLLQLELLEKYHIYFKKNNTSQNFQTHRNKELEFILNHEKQSQDLECDKYTLKKEVTTLKKQKRKQLKRTIQKGTILTGYLTALTTLGVSGILFAKYAATHKEYYTIEETYNANDDILTKKEYYEDSIKETIKRIDYSNLDCPTLFGFRYKRKIEIYDVSNLEYEDLKEYSLLDMDSLNIEPESSMQTKYRLPNTDYYEEPLIEIKKITHNQKKYAFKFNIAQFAFILWTEYDLTKRLYFYYLIKNYRNNKFPKTPIKDVKQEYHELIYYKKKLELEKKKLSLLDNYLEKIESPEQKNKMAQDEIPKSNHHSKKKELVKN